MNVRMEYYSMQERLYGMERDDMADWLLVPIDDGDGCFESCVGCLVLAFAIELFFGGCAAAGISKLRKKKRKK